MFVTHSRRAIRIASAYGWLPGARYTNLRDVRACAELGFLDIDWRNYKFSKHLEAARATRPRLTVARDIVHYRQLNQVLDEAGELARWAQHVLIVPKSPKLGKELPLVVPSHFILGYSVPTRYGGTRIPVSQFQRPVHLLGGRPDIQRRLGSTMPVVSFDCNRFTLDAAFGDFFDGERFRPHPVGGYERCLEASVANITELWADYQSAWRWDTWSNQQAA